MQDRKGVWRAVTVTCDGVEVSTYELADELWAPAYLSEDAQEGPRAFREKRAPQWKGR